MMSKAKAKLKTICKIETVLGFYSIYLAEITACMTLCVSWSYFIT